MARYFDGVDDYIEVPDSGVLDLVDNFTLMAWVWLYANTTTINLAIFDKGQYGYALLYRTNNTISLATSWVALEVTSNVTIPLQQWVHVAAVKSGSTPKLYFNGIDVTGSVSVQTYSATTATLRIGRRQPPSDETKYLKGYLADLRIYSRALSQQEIRAEMYRRTPAKQGLVFYLPLWEPSGSIVLDHSGNNNNGTVYGATYADDPPMLGGSMVTP